MSDRRLVFEQVEPRIALAADAIEVPSPLSVDPSPVVAVTFPVDCASAIECQVQALRFWEFATLQPSEVPFLTTEQIASIPNGESFATWSSAARAALSPTQVQALELNPGRIHLLTPTQISQLTIDQIRAVPFYDLDLLHPNQIPHVSPSRIGEIQTRIEFATWSAASRAALNLFQVQALQFTPRRIDLLTPTQIGYLSTSQIREIPFYDLDLLQPSQIPLVTPGQIAGIRTRQEFMQWSPAARAAMTAPQVQAISLAYPRIDFLTATQVSYLTTSQIQSLPYFDFSLLSPNQVRSLTPGQLASIPSAQNLGTWSTAARAALLPAQVQALRLDPLPLDLLTPTQIATLTPSQISAVPFYDLDQLAPSQIPYVTPSQLAGIQTREAFAKWSPQARAVLNPSQVQALQFSPGGIDLLTTTQISYLTPQQIAAVPFYDLDLLAPSQIRHVFYSQIAEIPTREEFAQWSPEARAALNLFQIQSLQLSPARIDLLTPTQIAYLNVRQLHAIPYYDIPLLHPFQIPQLSTEQIASIPAFQNLGTWTAQARAALTTAQIQALSYSPLPINLLTASQISSLTPAQIRIVPVYDLPLLPAEQVRYLTTDQIGEIGTRAELERWQPSALAALSPAQIQALEIDPFRIDLLSPSQIAQLSVDQVRSVAHYELRLLNPSQIPLVTSSQLAALRKHEFAAWNEASRLALSTLQLRALSMEEIGLDLLTEAQIRQLSLMQIQSVHPRDFARLPIDRINWLAPSQFAQVTNTYWITSMSEAVRAAMSRDQILSLPIDIWGAVSGVPVNVTPPAAYRPDSSFGVAADGLANDSRTLAEHAALLQLVPVENATHTTVRSGSWTDPATWNTATVPQAGADVVIGEGHEVLLNSVLQSPIHTLRIDGKLTFAHNVNTQLRVDTIVVTTQGTLQIGTASQPIQAGRTATILFTNGEQIDPTWDPRQLSRGLLSRGTVRIYGSYVTPYVAVATPPQAGDTQLHLTQAPTRWKVGDKLILTGVYRMADSFLSDELTILAINGSTVTVTPLQYNHIPPAGYDLSVYVANQERNVVFSVDDPTAPIAQRPHIMFVHNPDVEMVNAAVNGFGRTNKLERINSPVVTDFLVAPGTGSNARGRYAVHFHRTGVDPHSTPALVEGSIVNGSPGWGITNHQSHVIVRNNVAYQVTGAAFVTEDGNERGRFEGNLAIATWGSNESTNARSDIHDFGHGGHGFWLQGPGVEVVNNIVAGASQAGIVIYNASSKTMLETSLLDDPAWGGPGDVVPLSAVPLAKVSGNTVFASFRVLDHWYVTPEMSDGNTVIEDLTGWNITGAGILAEYSGHVTYRGLTLIGTNGSGSVGYTSSPLSHDLVFENVRIERFETGLNLTGRRTATVINGRFEAQTAISIRRGASTTRQINILGSPVFAPASPALLNGRPQYDIYLSSDPDVLYRSLEAVISPDSIRVNTASLPNARLYFLEQAANYVPFAEELAYNGYYTVPDEWLGLTNQQLWNSFGVAYAGELLPSDAEMLPRIRGYVVEEVVELAPAGQTTGRTSPAPRGPTFQG